MDGHPIPPLRERLETVLALAHLLQRVEGGSVRAGARQYRELVLRLQSALSGEMPADALNAIFNAYPAAAEVYENVHYQHAGLARSPLERSAASELQTRQLLARIAAKRAPAG